MNYLQVQAIAEKSLLDSYLQYGVLGITVIALGLVAIFFYKEIRLQKSNYETKLEKQTDILKLEFREKEKVLYDIIREREKEIKELNELFRQKGNDSITVMSALNSSIQNMTQNTNQIYYAMSQELQRLETLGLKINSPQKTKRLND